MILWKLLFSPFSGFLISYFMGCSALLNDHPKTIQPTSHSLFAAMEHDQLVLNGRWPTHRAHGLAEAKLSNLGLCPRGLRLVELTCKNINCFNSTIFGLVHLLHCPSNCAVFPGHLHLYLGWGRLPSGSQMVTSRAHGPCWKRYAFLIPSFCFRF